VSKLLKMPLIKIATKINADIEICFSLSLSIDLHRISTKETGEQAIDGITSGLIGLGQSVTWQAKHFGITQRLTSKITKYNNPFHFRDEQVNGIFQSLVHDHYFQKFQNYTLMSDYFFFESPFGIFGKIFNKLILTNYMKNFLILRNNTIKEYAESDKWKALLIN